jgi:hypothetical protein
MRVRKRSEVAGRRDLVWAKIWFVQAHQNVAGILLNAAFTREMLPIKR